MAATRQGLFKRLLVGGNLRRTLIRASVLVLLCVVIFRYLLTPIRLEGESMEPTYTSGGFAFVNRMAYRSEPPARGDVVAVRLRASGRSIFYLKRVVGLPGETIGFKHGQLTVDGVPQAEDYLVFESDWIRVPVACKSGEFFVVGDNRSMPIEQHTFGRALESQIVGKVIF